MMHARRWKLSAAQRADMWNCWKAGQSLHAIGQALGKDHVVVQLLLARHGGIAPAARRRSRRVLTLAEREDISRGIASGCSMRVMARRLRRACSTVSREVARHGGRAQYRANQADQQARELALRPKACLLATHSKLQEIVASKLMQDWSPQQISGWLKQHYPDHESLRVSHETIYRSLFIQARGALKQELVRHLRSQRRIRRSRHSSVHGHSQGRIVDAISIGRDPQKSNTEPFPAIERAICCAGRATATWPRW
jgi:IS30 family transposase